MDPAQPEGSAESYDKVVDEFSFLIRDKNHDGVLERDEFDEGRSVFDKLSDPDRFERYDANGDGVVTRDEFLSGRAKDRVSEEDANLAASPLGPNDIGVRPAARERDGED